MNYDSMSNKELTSVHNALAEETGGAGDIKAWKGKKSDLIAKIKKLESLRPEPEPEPEQDDEPNKPKSGRQDTIRETSLELLCEVDYYEDKREDYGHRVPANHPHARSVGFTYNAIAERIRELHPGAGTKAESLRWYAVKVRDGEKGYEDYTLAQRRPRPKLPKRKETSE